MLPNEVNQFILDQIAKLRVIVSDNHLSDEDCHRIKTNLEALFQSLDSKCSKESASPQRNRFLT